MRKMLLPITTIWWREIIRFYRQRSRLFSAIAQPLVFWILIGSGLSASFQPSGVVSGPGYIEYFYPGIVVLVLLFTSIFATISVVNDRREGFLQGVLVAPVPRWRIVLAQALGGDDVSPRTRRAAPNTRTHNRYSIRCSIALYHPRRDGTFSVWLDKLGTAYRVADGLDARVSCNYEPAANSDMAPFRRVFSEYRCSRLVSMDNEVQSTNVWARSLSAQPLP